MPTTSRHLSITVLATLLVAASPAFAQDRAAAVPEMPVLLENACVRVQYHDVAVGEKTPMHSHPDYVVYVLGDYIARITTEDGTERISRHKAGESFWGEATQHVVENIGSTPVHNLVVELKPGEHATCQ